MVSTTSRRCFGIFSSICTSSFFLIAFAKPMRDDFRPKADLVCYECTRTADNDSCALNLELIPEITVRGQDFRCRVYEMDGLVVARGVVPSSLCTEEAFVKINLNVAQFSKMMNASGPVHASCCNEDKCNVDFCRSEERTSDCSTLISVLNGELAKFVDGDQVKQRIETLNKLVVESNISPGQGPPGESNYPSSNQVSGESSSLSDIVVENISGNSSSSGSSLSGKSSLGPKSEFEFYSNNNGQKSASLQSNGTNNPDLGQLTQRSHAFIVVGSLHIPLVTILFKTSIG